MPVVTYEGCLERHLNGAGRDLRRRGERKKEYSMYIETKKTKVNALRNLYVVVVE